jgi:drug/metabolite transporter (DMT)-like permease
VPGAQPARMAPIHPAGLRGDTIQPNLRLPFAASNPPLPARPQHHQPLRWLNNQPYFLLALASLFWAGNIVLARHVAGHVPPLTLSCLRWIGTSLMLLPFAWPHLKTDWPILRARWPLLLLLALTGFAINNALSYWAMQYTQALNGLLIQSSTPLFVALWSLALFGVRLTAAQFAGIAISLLGVLVILLRGDLSALAAIQFNRGDLMFAGALLVFGLYSALMSRRPRVHQLSLISFCTAAGAVLLAPLAAWEYATGSVFRLNLESLLTLAYVIVFASTLAYLFFNRGISLIGPNRAAPFLHLVPVFGSALAILLLGETPEPFHLIGYVLVLAGVIIAARQSGSPA